MRDIVSPDPTPEDISRGYEGTAVKVRGMAYFTVAFVLVAAVIHTIVWYLLVAVQGMTATAHAERFPPPVLDLARVKFPTPNLQPSPDHEKIDWQDQDDLRTEQVRSLRASGAFKDVPARERGTTGALPISGLVLPPLRVTDDVAASVGVFVGQSRTAPTTLPTGTGAAGNQPGPNPVVPSTTQPAGGGGGTGPATAPTGAGAADAPKAATDATTRASKPDAGPGEKKSGTEETGDKR